MRQILVIFLIVFFLKCRVWLDGLLAKGCLRIIIWQDKLLLFGVLSKGESVVVCNSTHMEPRARSTFQIVYISLKDVILGASVV